MPMSSQASRRQRRYGSSQTIPDRYDLIIGILGNGLVNCVQNLVRMAIHEYQNPPSAMHPGHRSVSAINGSKSKMTFRIDAVPWKAMTMALWV